MVLIIRPNKQSAHEKTRLEAGFNRMKKEGFPLPFFYYISLGQDQVLNVFFHGPVGSDVEVFNQDLHHIVA